MNDEASSERSGGTGRDGEAMGKDARRNEAPGKLGGNSLATERGGQVRSDDDAAPAAAGMTLNERADAMEREFIVPAPDRRSRPQTTHQRPRGSGDDKDRTPG